jgi:hypothetical protein
MHTNTHIEPFYQARPAARACVTSDRLNDDPPARAGALGMFGSNIDSTD